jgi:DnaJ-class molecular chaperone
MTLRGNCPECNGKGWIEMKCIKADEARVCPHCNGSGLTPLEKDCSACHGTGVIETRIVEQQKCAKCEGSGRFPPPEKL